MNATPDLPPALDARGLGRLAGACFDHRRGVLLIWATVLIAVIALSQVVGGHLSDSFSSGSSPSGQAQALLAQRFPTQAGDSANVVVHTTGSVRAPATAARIDYLVGALRPLPRVSGVTGPLGPAGRHQVSADGHTAYAVVQFDALAQDLPKAAVRKVVDTAQGFAGPGFQVALGGNPISSVASASPGSSEGVGITAAIIIMLLAFGSIIAMGLPILTALLGVGIAFGLVDLLSQVLTVPTFGPEMMAMIGLGVGIDYSLFVVTRYRQYLREGATPRDATVTALATSGRAVAFAGGTVVISLFGLFLIAQAYMDGLALASIFAVVAVLAGALTLLPATFGVTGHAIDRLRIPTFGRRRAARAGAASGARAAARGGAAAGVGGGEAPRPRSGPVGMSNRGFWYRWSRMVQRRPLPCAVAAVVILGVLAIPLFSMRLAFADAGNDPTSLTTRQAFDLLADGFGPGFNGPLILAIELPDKSSLPVAQDLARRVAATPGVASVNPLRLDPNGDTAVIIANPTTAPAAAATVDLVHHLRDQVIPAATSRRGVTVLVGGETAAGVDAATHLSSRLPWVIALVIVLSFVLLAAVFRSIVIPVKAAVMNLLSIGAAYGVIVAVFQWGWGAGALGGSGSGPIDPWIPLMIFVITFGLSMDYEVFLLSRMKEEWRRTGDNATAVSDGLASTARVITAAAAIMVCVFGSFVINDPLRILDIFGLGLAAAIFVDATVVRMVLVPALMEMLGDRNWWMPGWLDRHLPTLGVEADPSTI